MTVESETLYSAARNFKIRFGYFIRQVGLAIQPDYWICIYCGHIKYNEEEVICLKCGIGDMIYKGDLE